MNIVKAVQAYLAPVLGDLTVCLGAWDESPGEARTEYLSINMDGGQRPGVISKTKIVELWYVTQRGAADMTGGKMTGYNRAAEIEAYIEGNPKSSCFANVILIAGIIGPKDTEHLRQAYYIPIEITY